ncbi:MAG TPA: hypothetical protein VNT25_07390 [Allosphingosinicella sp.]|nr:hypothetical protein [Allosphingosinicella sp.]
MVELAGLLLLLAAPVDAPPADGADAARYLNLQIHASRRPISTEIQAGMVEGGAGGVWLQRRVSSRKGVVHETTLAECPAVAAQLKALGDLRLPTIDPDLQPDQNITIDIHPSTYRLSLTYLPSPGRFLVVEGKTGTPLARWGDSFAAALEPCWRTVSR